MNAPRTLIQKLHNEAQLLRADYQFESALEVVDVALGLGASIEQKAQLVELRTQLERLLENRNRRKLDFLVIGAQKAGTTALAAFLRRHAEICTPPFKEMHYFDSRGISTAHVNYHRCFFPRPEHRVLGERTPIYMHYPGAMEQIRLYRPDIKLIVLLRDPIERAISHWNMMLQKKDVRAADMSARAWIQFRESTTGFTRFDVVGRGLYAQQLDRLFSLFPRKQVLIYRSEEQIDNHDAVMDRVAAHLGVSAFPRIEQRLHNAGEYEQRLGRQDYLVLRDYFRPDVERIRKEVGVDTSGWMRAYD